MKTLIVYGTKYGYAKECASHLKTLLSGDVEMAEAASAVNLSVPTYDQVIIGGSIYMGKVQKSVRDFCIQHEAVLAEKKVGLFLCCGLPENFAQNLEAAFPETLRKRAASTECFGGRMDISRMGFLHRTVAKMMTKSVEEGKTPPVQAFPEHIQRMAEHMQGV